nr:hypothetical protein [Tanacetum cinerariifolium]
MVEALQESPLGMITSNVVTNPHAELKAITTMDGSTLDGYFIPHSNILAYQEEEQELETITEVVEITSSQSTPLVPPPETPPLIDIVDSLCNESSGNPTPSFDHVVASLARSSTPCGDSDSLLVETDTLLSYCDDSSPDYETFCFDIEEKRSGSVTTHSLLDYEAFCFDFDHIKEKSSGSTTSYSDLSYPEYESFHFDLSIYHLPSANRSDSHHEEFTDELAHIISSL